MYHHNTGLQDPELSAVEHDGASGGRSLATTDVGTVPVP